MNSVNGSKKAKNEVSILQTGRGAVRALQTQVEKQPYVAIAVVGGVALGIGALMGSHVGRVITFLCASYVVKELTGSTVGQKMTDAIRKSVGDLSTSDMRS